MTQAVTDIATIWGREVAVQLSPLCFDVTGQDGSDIYHEARGGGPTAGDLRAMDADGIEALADAAKRLMELETRPVAEMEAAVRRTLAHHDGLREERCDV